MKRYLALIQIDEPDRGYGVIFPDLPGCTTVGDTFDQALTRAAEALALYAEATREAGGLVPEPRDMEAIRTAAEDWVHWEGSMAAMIPLLPAPGSPARLNVSLDSGLVAAVDAEAKRRGMTRSGFLAEAAKLMLASDLGGGVSRAR